MLKLEERSEEAIPAAARNFDVMVEAQPASSAVVRSALWAAWGDALGFPTELARDPGMVQRRLDTPVVNNTVGWSRRVGGRYGPTVPLTAGTYSDDTQLRLAVGRCIRTAGGFDVEAFSKIELPIFLSYGLGIGRGTKAAANSLEKRAVRWYTNFYATPARYIDGGGNGAAMRIQPHVWASGDFRPESYLSDVVRDAITTHGHPRAIVGAALHALSLGTALRESKIPVPARWPGMARYLERLANVVGSDEVLRDEWIPRWERETRRPWLAALRDTINETTLQLEVAARAVHHRSPADAYAALASELGGLDPATRGSGVTSAVLAVWLAHTNSTEPESAIVTAANLLGSDTDTIASMAGALVGVVADDEPEGSILDRELIASEATRLDGLRDQPQTKSFPHPDPLKWQPPKTLADAVGLHGTRVAVAGLGNAKEDSELYVADGRDGGVWQWLRLDFGQRILIKRRRELRPLGDYALPRARQVQPEQIQLPTTARHRDQLPDSVEEAARLLEQQDFDGVLAMRLLAHLANQNHGVEKAALFGGLVAQALRAPSSGRSDRRASSRFPSSR